MTDKIEKPRLEEAIAHALEASRGKEGFYFVGNPQDIAHEMTKAIHAQKRS